MAQALQSLGFQPVSGSLSAELLRSGASSGELRSGTSVVLEHPNRACRIVITYDEQVALQEHVALEEGYPFYSAENNRRPDIRLDMYERADGGEVGYGASSEGDGEVAQSDEVEETTKVI